VLWYASEAGLPGVAMCVSTTYGSGDWGRTPHGAFIASAVFGNEWHAVLANGDEPAGSIIEPIGTGSYADAYWYCVNHYHWDIVSPDPRDPRRRAV
jgi:hypothetical protein